MPCRLIGPHDALIDAATASEAQKEDPMSPERMPLALSQPRYEDDVRRADAWRRINLRPETRRPQPSPTGGRWRLALVRRLVMRVDAG